MSKKLPGTDSEFDQSFETRWQEMVLAMQTEEHRIAVDALFSATPEELAKAAVAQAKMSKQ